jgi:histidinol-phosphate aminotransferase
LNDEKGRWLKERLEEIRSLWGYKAGETLGRAAQKSKIKPSEILKLNSNENFFVPRGILTQLLKEVVEEVDLRIYPQEEEKEIKEALGKYLGVPSKCIMVESGSDPLIAFISSLFIERGDEALSVAPTFGIYKHMVDLRGAMYLSVLLKEDFSMDMEEISAKVTTRTKLFFLCSPNNPTANQFKIDEIQSLIKDFPGLVIIDEAYGEFADYTAVPLVEKFENLMVLRTFSKTFGLAGLRLGYAVANPELAATLSEKAQLPYPVSSIALRMGLKLLSNIEVIKDAIERLKRERDRLIRGLNAIKGVTAFNSKANFVLFQTEKASDEIYQALLDQGVLVRNLGRVLHLERCLRTTVGLPEMNEKTLAVLKHVFR